MSVFPGQRDEFKVVGNACIGVKVSESAGECSIAVECDPEQPGQHRAQLLIDIPSHRVTEASDLQQDATAPATALPAEPTDEATPDTHTPDSASPGPTLGNSAGPPAAPQDPQVPVPDFPITKS